MPLGSILGFVGSKQAQNTIEDTTQQSLDFQREALNKQLAFAQQSQDYARQALSPSVESQGQYLNALNAFVLGQPLASTAGGFNPATGLWQGTVPYSPNGTTSAAPANAFAAPAAAPAQTAMSAAPQQVAPQQAAQPQSVLPAGLTYAGIPSYAGQENGAGGIRIGANYFSGPNEANTYLAQREQMAAQQQQAAQAPAAAPTAPVTPIALPNSQQVQQGAQDAYSAFNNRIYGDFQADPGYQFRVNEGSRMLQNAFGGSAQSGAALRAAQDYGQGLAAQGYNDWWNRQRTQGLDYITTLQAGANTGQTNTAVAANNNALGQMSNAFGAYGANSGNLAANSGANIAGLQQSAFSTLGQGLSGALGFGLGALGGGGGGAAGASAISGASSLFNIPLVL